MERSVCVCFVTEHHVKKNKTHFTKKKYTISLGLARETWLRCRKQKCSHEGEAWGWLQVVVRVRVKNMRKREGFCEWI